MSRLTYITSALLLATAVTAQTANNTQAITNAAKANLDLMKQKEDSRNTPITGISADCQTAISGRDVNPECVDDIETNPQDKDFAATCTAPADGGKDHRCSADQVLKALDILESKCSAELTAKNADIVGYFSRWQTYTINYNILCTKNSAGNYCILDTANTNATNNQCVTEQLKLVKEWKAPRQDKYTNDSAASLRTSAADLAKQNSVNVNTGSSSNGTNGSKDNNSSSKMSSLTTSTAAFTAGLLAIASL
ncbi:hypothetical protein BDF19DRAFT_449535 [Syncephalis fuscata]|nr:hypothetical protein BDF19DRAFT_449535 [Syncephalis fuscata]